MVRTDYYFPYQVAVAPDDTIWTLGYEMVNLNTEHPATNREAHILRHFDSAGKMIGSFFPQSQFNRYDRFRLADGLFVAARDRLGWYGPRSGKSVNTVYTEISFETMNMKRYPGAPSSDSKSVFADGLAVTSNGVAVVSIEDDSPGARSDYVLDRGSSSWVPVSVPRMGGFHYTPILIGSDGDNLVFKYGRETGFFKVSQH